MKKLLIALVAIFLLLQLIPKGTKNIEATPSPNHIAGKYAIPADVDSLLKVGCNDCHSNNTVYPWYYSIQPVALWMNRHVNEGKRKLNFSELGGKRIAVQYHKFEEIEEMVSEGEMPLPSYTWTHTNAKFTPQQRDLIIQWSRAVRDTIKARYPADSLKMPAKVKK